MELRVLRYFQSIARLGNITRAATELHIAQPALSVAIQKLEDELGVALFTRVRNKPVTLTPEGAILLARAERIFQEVDSVRLEIADSQELRTGEVRVGMPPMYGLRYFPTLMRTFHRAFPGIRVTAIQGSAGDVRAMLEAGTIDLAILESRRIERSWAHVALDKEELVLCVHREHHLAGQARFLDTDLDQLELILLDESFLQRNLIDQRCSQAGVSYRVVMQTNYVPFALQAAADGIGAVTLLRSMIDMHAELVGLPFEPPEFFQFNLCWNDEQYTSKANRAFIDFVDQYHHQAEDAQP